MPSLLTYLAEIQRPFVHSKLGSTTTYSRPSHLRTTFLKRRLNVIRFRTRSGELTVTREDDLYALDFPARPPSPCEYPKLLVEGLGLQPQEVWAARDYMAVFESEDEVLSLEPDMAKLAKVDRFAVIATAPGTDSDFVSRFFAPAKGVPEDPVTGSAHCTLIPYWSDFLGKQRLLARQVSRRGGELICEDLGERVKIAGRAVLFASGMIHL
jgi:predicted PhzF superfamily epimerase YddE/YHI9